MDVVEQAGAITVRGQRRNARVLIVTAKKNPDHWIFPKGHIEPGETAEQAAVRELREEAGAEGKALAYVGALEFTLNDQVFHVEHYLIRYIAEVPSEEGRARLWCTLEEALRRLTFEDARRLLAEKAWPLIVSDSP